MLDHKLITALIAIIVVVILIIVYQFLYIRFAGSPVPAPDIPRMTSYGQGPPLTFVVMGDSTAIGQGAEYEQSIAVQSAQFLAENYSVELTNLGVSGATTRDVKEEQLAEAVSLTPDVVLLAIGANDVTHFSNANQTKLALQTIITTLQDTNSSVDVILTGSPEMGSVDRFPKLTQWIAHQRVLQLNEAFDRVAANTGAVRLPIAEKTGPLFDQNPQLFAADKFHPNATGYATWQPIINDALQTVTK